TASDDGNARVWDVGSGRCILMLRGHTRPINWAAFSPNQIRIATASNDGTVLVWDAGSGQLVKKLRGPEPTGWVLSGEFSPDSTRIVTTTGDTEDDKHKQEESPQ